MVALLVLLIGLKERKPPPEELPPPAVAVVFEGGSKQGPTQPEPAPVTGEQGKPAENQTPPSPAQPSPEQTPPEPPQQQARTDAPPPEPAPQPEAPAKPTETTAPTPPSPEQAQPPPQQQALTEEPAEPVPAPAPEPVKPEAARPAPPRVTLALPRPPRPELAMPELPRMPEAPLPPKPRPAPPQQRDAFAPMLRHWSLGQQPPLSPRSSGGARVAGANSNAATQIQGAEALGADWRNMLSAWVEAHKYYPRQAIMNGEDGSPEVEVVVRRDGTVRSVELETRSGSQWLDLALLALFRGAHLPPFPENARDDETTFSFTMHYILTGR